MLRDVAKSKTQKLAEAEISRYRDALGPFVTAAEATRMPMMFTGAQPSNYPIIFINQAFLNLTGYEEHELMGQSFDALMEQGTDPEMLTEIRTAFSGGRDLESEVRYIRKDKNPVWVTINVAPVRDAEGKVVQFFASFINVTAQKEEAARLISTVERLNATIKDMTGPDQIK